MASKPIEQLIHDLEQKRAKEHWERAQRFKAQQEEQRKAGEARQKKQLEYMRSAGIKLNEFEKDQEEDARKLKSYLEQKRRPLISRPTMSGEDAKHAADWAANLVDLGILAPPAAAFYLPRHTQR